MASEKQTAFIRRLVAERDTTDAGPIPAPDTLSTTQASVWIDVLMRCPKAAAAPDAGEPVTEPGMYRKGEDIYKVQRSRTSGRLYAKRLQAIGGRRMIDATEDVVSFEFVYANGDIFKLSPTDAMSREDAQAFGIRYGVCCVCAAALKDAESVALGIGPVCRKRF